MSTLSAKWQGRQNAEVRMSGDGGLRLYAFVMIEKVSSVIIPKCTLQYTLNNSITGYIY